MERRHVGLAAAASVLLAACSGSATDELVAEDQLASSESALTTTVKLFPRGDVAASGMVANLNGAPLSNNLYVALRDGAAFTDADDAATFVNGSATQLRSSHRVRFGAGPARPITRVVVSYRAQANLQVSTAPATIRTRIYSGGVALATGGQRLLGSAWTSYTDTFNVQLPASAAVDVEVIFDAARTDAARYTALWATVTGTSPDPMDAGTARESLCTDNLDNDGDGRVDCADTDCDQQVCTATGLRCSGGTCGGPFCAGPGINCGPTTVCCNGLACVNGACGGPTCTAAGSPCSGAALCCNGLACTNGICGSGTICGSAGTACTANSACCSGLACVSGTCQATNCAPSGAQCGAGVLCCPGLACTATGRCG